MPAEALRHAVRRLSFGESLSSLETTNAFREVMAGDGTPALISALLTALRVKGETPEEVAGAAMALREAMTPLNTSAPESLVDTCGTGGGAVATFNISTAAAIVVAGAGVRVAKHGNRSMTTKCGSADVLEALGVAIDIPAEKMPAVLDEAGIVFMFAPTMHPAMRHVGPVRREIGITTVMNMVGPLANPARAGRQVVGVPDQGRAELMAGALSALGTVHSLVVHGEPGMDEVSPLGKTTVIEIRGAESKRWTIDPSELGFTRLAASDLDGAEPSRNAEKVLAVLNGKAPPGAEAAVLLNAGAALLVAGLATTLAAAIQVARESISSGAASHALEKLRRATKS